RRRAKTELCPDVAIVVARGDQQVVAGFVIASPAMPIADSIAIILAAAERRGPAIKLSAVGTLIAVESYVAFGAVLIAWRILNDDVDEAEAGAITQAVGSWNHDYVLNHAGINFREHA